jgi:hypothetical protein
MAVNPSAAIQKFLSDLVKDNKVLAEKVVASFWAETPDVKTIFDAGSDKTVAGIAGAVTKYVTKSDGTIDGAKATEVATAVAKAAGDNGVNVGHAVVGAALTAIKGLIGGGGGGGGGDINWDPVAGFSNLWNQIASGGMSRGIGGAGTNIAHVVVGGAQKIGNQITSMGGGWASVGGWLVSNAPWLVPTGIAVMNPMQSLLIAGVAAVAIGFAQDLAPTNPAPKPKFA